MKRRVTFTTRDTPAGCTAQLVWSTGRKQIKQFRNGTSNARSSAQAWIKQQIDVIKEHVVTSKVKLEMPEIIVDGKEWDNEVAAERSARDFLALALDVSLEKARALHRVWRALNDGDCPKCHTYHPATEIFRGETFIQCPTCKFDIESEEIKAIERMFAPAMDAATKIFEDWREERAAKRKAYYNAMAYWENEKYMFPESEWSEREPKLEEFIK